MIFCMSEKIRSVALALALVAFAMGRAEACMVCIPFPLTTGADHLADAETVVLARENPGKPFTFIAVEILKGALEEPGIDLFLNSATRRRLAQNPDRSVVLALRGRASPAKAAAWPRRLDDSPPAGAEWQHLGYATARYEALVRKIIAQAPSWRADRTGRDRAAFFMPYLSDTDRLVRELAYLEVARAPYDQIRQADAFVPPTQVHDLLANPQFIEWHAFYILLLGVGASEDERKSIWKSMRAQARHGGTTNLAAWATALIEIGRADAVGWLERTYLGAADRDPDAVLEIVKALSVQGTKGHPPLRARIAAAYMTLLDTHPALAGWVARDLAAWGDWRHVQRLRRLQEGPTELDGASDFSIAQYLAQAGDNKR